MKIDVFKFIIGEECSAAGYPQACETHTWWCLLEHITPGDFDLPKVCNLRRMANQVRANKRPEEPKDLNFHVSKIFFTCMNSRKDNS